MVQALPQYVIKAYDRPMEERIRRVADQILVQLDELGPKGDCLIFPSMYILFPPNGDHFTLVISNSPVSQEIETLVQSRDGTITTTGDTSEIRVTLGATDGPFIHQLAAAIRSVTLRPAKRLPYRVYSCRWRFPRATKILDDFAVVLQRFCNSQSQPRKEESL